MPTRKAAALPHGSQGRGFAACYIYADTRQATPSPRVDYIYIYTRRDTRTRTRRGHVPTTINKKILCHTAIFVYMKLCMNVCRHMYRMSLYAFYYITFVLALWCISDQLGMRIMPLPLKISNRRTNRSRTLCLLPV